MNISVMIAGAAVLTVLFTAAAFATTGGNRTVQLNNYPPEIAEEYLKTHGEASHEQSRGRIIKKKLAGLVFFLIFFAVLARLAGAETFSQGFLLAFGIMLWVGAYDTFFLDWVLFANMKRFRLEGTEHMDREYHRKWFHLKGMLIHGIPAALAAGTAVGALTALIL